MKLNHIALTATLVASASLTVQSLPLKISIDGVTSSCTIQEEYDQGQNHVGASDVIVSSDGTSADMVGNLWRAFSLPEDLEVTDSTVLRFDFELKEEADFQAICVDEDKELSDEKRCFVLANTQGWVMDMYNAPHMATLSETNVHFDIPIGKFFTGNMKYLVLLQDNDVDNSVGSSTISNIVIDHEERGGLTLRINGEVTEINNNPISYSDQDHGDNMLHMSEDGTSMQVSGNTWKALEFTSPVEIDSETVFEFDYTLIEEFEKHLICFDNDLTFGNSKTCFGLSGSETGGEIHYLDRTEEGETKHYSISVGKYFTGSFKYLVVVLDNDTSDRSTGNSLFSNLELHQEERASFKIQVGGEEMSISATDGSYSSNQDTISNFLEISEDGLSAKMEGNQWKSVTLPAPIEINAATNVDFDFYLEELTEYHGICFDDNLNDSDSKRCFVTANRDNWSQNNLSVKTDVGETKHYSIPVGTYFTGSVNFVAFVQDNDSGDNAGVSAFSNIAFSQRPELNLGFVQGGVRQGLPLFNHQLSYAGNQDTVSNLVDVSSDGESVTLRGNLFKAFEIPGGLTIDDNSVLSFKFLMEEIAEITGICIEENLELEDDFPRCFPLAGDQDVSNDANWLYRGVEQTYSTNEWQTYVIRLSEFFHGDDFKYLVLVQDNDKTDRTTGTSTFKNIEFHETSQSCLKNVDFEFSFDECTIENFVNEVEQLMTNTPGCIGNNAWVELLAFFDVNSKLQIEEQIGAICTSGYKEQYLPFEVIMGKHFQFSDEFFDGGTTWNYENESRDDASRIKMVQENHANRAIGMPDVHNFKKCELRAAMCCYVASRKGTGVDAEPEDNSDACYMDFSGAQQSSHVRDGYSIYGNGVEGNLNCHGFAWGDDVGNADNALKGNSLFQVAMYDSLYEKGLAEELPGAPMCGCVEQMPVVTKANCTKVEVDQTVDVNYNGSLTEFSVNVEIRTINHVPCTDNDLSSHYQDLVEEGKASQMEKDYLDTRLVGEGNCPGAISTFLSEKGFSFS